MWGGGLHDFVKKKMSNPSISRKKIYRGKEGGSSVGPKKKKSKKEKPNVRVHCQEKMLFGRGG